MMKEQLRELIPFYALGTLTEEEATAVEEYLEANPEALPELAETKQVVSALAYQAPPLTPSPRLKERLKEQIEADRQVQTASPASTQSGLRQRFSRLWPQFSQNLMIPALAGLSLVVAILVGVWAISLQNELSQLRDRLAAVNIRVTPLEEEFSRLQQENITLKQELAAQRDDLLTQLTTLRSLRDEVNQLQIENESLAQAVSTQNEQLTTATDVLTQLPEKSAALATLEQNLAAQEQRIGSLQEELTQLRTENALLLQELDTQRTVMVHATSPNVQIMPLAGTETIPRAHGQLIANPFNETGALVVSGLPSLQPGLVYQFWLVQEGQPQKAGVIDVDQEGLGILIVTSDKAIGTFEGMGVSIEPVEGDQQPTNNMIMVGDFSLL